MDVSFGRYRQEMSLNMYILLIVWFVIDAVLLMILPFRKQITKYPNKMWKRSIEKVKKVSERAWDALEEFGLLILLCIFIYVIIYFIPDIGIQKFLEWYEGIFIVALFPMLFTWFKGNNIGIKSKGKVSLFALAIFVSIVGTLIDTEKVEVIVQYRNALNVFIAIVLGVFLAALYRAGKESNKYYTKRLPEKGIRKDLYYRTPGLMVNVSDVELVRYCERYFDEYICQYRKMKNLRTMEYVNLTGIHRKLWYEKAACIMKIFVAVTIFIVIISLKSGISYMLFGVIVSLFAFGILISIYKHMDLECLYRLGIRYAYDDWGYYLTCAGKGKFVGNVQMIAVSKFHKYVHSFLDIAALCRAIAFSDKMTGENKIGIITRNLGELFINYTDYEQEKNWIMVIPLWIAALFEFYVTEKVEPEIKEILLKSTDESVRADISIFLQSFWADMERKELQNGVLDYLKLFKDNLYI